jgi:GlpG protein
VDGSNAATAVFFHKLLGELSVATNTVRVLTLPTSIDLELFCAHLAQQRVRFRIFEEQGQQVLEVAGEADAERVRADYAAWRDGRLVLNWLPLPPRPSLWSRLRRYPVVTWLMATALVFFPATWPLDSGVCGPLLPWLTIVPVASGDCRMQIASLQAVFASGQLWRFVTPIFIHFGIAHLLFNAAVVIEFGRRIERGAGSIVLLGLMLLIAIASNAMQFVVSGAALFGGLSGVAYGLFAYVVVRGRYGAAQVWRVNPSFTVAVVVILVLMSTGVTELVGLHIANTAHWVGLAVGALAALVWRRSGNDGD